MRGAGRQLREGVQDLADNLCGWKCRLLAVRYDCDAAGIWTIPTRTVRILILIT